MTYREEELHDGDLELTARAKAHMTAGEPTQAGGSSAIERSGEIPAAPASPASPAEEVAELLRAIPHVRWLYKDGEAQEPTPLMYVAEQLARSLRAPSSAPRGPSAEAVEAALNAVYPDLPEDDTASPTQRELDDKWREEHRKRRLLFWKVLNDHPQISEDKGV